jgi:hypothetical protein
MDIEKMIEKVRADLRERPGSHFSEVYFRTAEHGAGGTEIRYALYELLKRDEVRVKDGKLRLVAPVERRKVF